MSMYTTELRYICETLAGKECSTGLNEVSGIIEKARSQIFSFDYPIYDTAYKSVLETKILRHYYTCEIGQETYGLWKLMLESTMNDIMPYYNLLYKSAQIEFDPMSNIHYIVTHTGSGEENRTGNESASNLNTRTSTNEGKSKSTTTVEGQTNSTDNRTRNLTTNDTDNTTIADKKVDLYSDTPQNGLTDVEAGKYLTNARIDTGNGSTDRTYSRTEGGTDNHTVYGSNSSTTGVDGTTSGNSSVMDNVSSSNESSSTAKSTDEYVNKYSGWNGGSYSSELLKYRETLMNIDLMIIQELKTLFFGLWN